MNKLTKRLFLGSMLGLVFGILCFAGFVSNPNIGEEAKVFQVWSMDNAMMWTIILNRFILGITVAITGFITLHPVFKFRIHPILRGAKMGILVSLLMATGVLIGEPDQNAWFAFWLILIIGAIIGAVIDVIITKCAGEGEELIIQKNKNNGK